MNEKITQLTEELKRALAETDEVKNYLVARQAYVSDAALMTLANEYNVQTQVYEQESHKDQPDRLLLASVKSRLDSLYNQIIENPVAKAYGDSEAALTDIYSELNEALQSIVMPEQHDCGGHCDSCGGCH